MLAEELTKILKLHKEWIDNNIDGKKADLGGADLQGADLGGANLREANLRGADITNTLLPDYQICPEIGSFIAFKKGRNNCILKLYIPASAKRTSSLVGRKCRASKAKVLSIINIDGNKIKSCKCWNPYYDFIYTVGKTVYPDKYDDDIRIECSSGIHFFITEKEAKEF